MDSFISDDLKTAVEGNEPIINDTLHQCHTINALNNETYAVSPDVEPVSRVYETLLHLANGEDLTMYDKAFLARYATAPIGEYMPTVPNTPVKNATLRDRSHEISPRVSKAQAALYCSLGFFKTTGISFGNVVDDTPAYLDPFVVATLTASELACKLGCAEDIAQMYLDYAIGWLDRDGIKEDPVETHEAQ